MEQKLGFGNFDHKGQCFQTGPLHKRVVGLRMEWTGECAPSFQGNPWTKAEDPVGPFWAVCAKEVGTIGTLGTPVTIPPEAPARLGGTDGWTTRLVGVNGVVGMLDLGVLTRGGSTPSAGMAEVKMKEISPALDIILPIGTPITSGSKGRT